MKYEYTGVTGKTEIEVDDGWADVLYELDRLEYNNDHAETRRHASLDAYDLDGTLFSSGENIPAEYEAREGRAALDAAIEKLKPAQRDLIRAVYFDGVSVNELADREGVDHSAISHRLQTAYKNLKNLL